MNTQTSEDRAAALIIRQRHILLIHRVRNGSDYYVFPGGHIEAGENAEEACLREVTEETGLGIAWIAPGFDYLNPERGRREHYFLIEPLPGTPVLSGPELEKRSPENRYLHEWVPLTQLSQFNLRPVLVRDALAALVAEQGPIQRAADLAPFAPRLQAAVGKNS